MSAFGGLILTNKGRALQTKAQTGIQLIFTKVKVGNGELSGQSILELNDLISSKKELSILELKTQPEGKASLKSFLSNSDIITGFYWRELGVFAQDPDEGEILYCYGNAGANAEYIPAGGGADVLEKYINIVTIVGNASNISATLGSEIYVTQSALDEHTGNTNNPHNVTVSQIGAETPSGAQIKADQAEANAKAYADSIMPTATSQLTNDSGYITAGEAPVQSVNNKTGTVTLSASDIGAETPSGAQAKADAALAAANTYTDQEVGAVSQTVNAHLAENVSNTVFITEPYAQTTKTTVDLGFKPKQVNIIACIRNSKYWSIGSQSNANGFCIFKLGWNDTKDIQTPYIIVFRHNTDNSIEGTVIITDTGIEIQWTVRGSLPDIITEQRRLIISAIAHGGV